MEVFKFSSQICLFLVVCEFGPFAQIFEGQFVSLQMHWLLICEFGPIFAQCWINYAKYRNFHQIFCKSNKIFGFYDNLTKIQTLSKFHGKQCVLCFQIN